MVISYNFMARGKLTEFQQNEITLTVCCKVIMVIVTRWFILERFIRNNSITGQLVMLDENSHRCINGLLKILRGGEH
jgi:hypothetical protein